MSLNPKLLADLKAKAEAATPGPWGVFETGSSITVYLPESYLGNHIACMARGGVPAEEEFSNAAYIAAANPATILALIAEIERRSPAKEGVATEEMLRAGNAALFRDFGIRAGDGPLQALWSAMLAAAPAAAPSEGVKL